MKTQKNQPSQESRLDYMFREYPDLSAIIMAIPIMAAATLAYLYSAGRI